MTSEHWDALVRRLDGLAKENPSGYRLRVGLLAALGYVYILGTLVVLAAAGVMVVLAATKSHAFILGKFLIPLGALALLILRALWVKIPPPEGIPLDRSTAAALWRLVDEVRVRVDGPRVDELLLNGELNARVAQIPRLGPVGWERNYLVVGLPLMQALTPDEFKAVVAHEFGHLSKRHGRFGSFIYRIRETWDRLLGTLDADRHWGRILFRRFFGWYAPYFSAYSFALVRAHEYEADQASAEAAGSRAAATALAALTVADRYLASSYWPGVFALTHSERRPPSAAFSGMAVGLAEARTGEQRVDWLRKALREPAGTADTHPSLSERLTELGVVPPESIIAAQNGAGETAAQRFLEGAEAGLAERLDEEWRQAVAQLWEEEHQETLEAEQNLAELERRSEQETQSSEELAERVYLTARLREPEQSIPLLEELLARKPDESAAHCILGSLLLDRGDDRGLGHLDRAMEAEPNTVFVACERAYLYLKEHQRDEEAESYRRRAQERADMLESGHSERMDVSPRGPFEPHALPPEEVERLRDALSRFKKIKRAYLVRKRMRHLDDEFPLHMVFLFPRGLIYDQQKLVEEVAATVQFDGWFFSPRETTLKRRKLDQIPGAKIYGR
jgi:Zn-dependent protease with chaperone function